MNLLKKYFDKLWPLDENDWKVFSGLFTEAVLEKGAYFAQEGKVEHQIALMTEGVTRGFYRSTKGTEYNKRFFLPLQLIGAYSSLVSRKPSKISIQAMTDCKLLVADFTAIAALFDEHPMIERIFRILPEFLYQVKENRELQLVMLNAEERYSIFLEDYPTLENIIPQYHIASYLGITPTQLSRIRGKKYTPGLESTV
ncbi:MAG: putative transcriptional regulator, Crp/Fnr family [Cytophagaceae bacterium]|jgi:CRP-like cAMP-binding protein|nr:putative transcriptional regulator, Crp/Fnr family [Cytophagaceae bacterium]